MDPEVGEARAPVAKENAGDPALLEQQDAEMPVDVPAECAMLWLTTKNVLA